MKKRMSLFIAAVLLASLFSGCTMFGEAYVAKVGNVKVIKPEYTFFLKDAENTIISLNQGNQVDWNQKFGNITAKEYVKQSALDSSVELEIQVMRANEAKISLTKQEKDDINSQIDSSLKQLGSTGLDQEKALKEKVGVTVKQFKDIYNKISLAKKYVSDVEGKYKYSDTDLLNYYNTNKANLDKVTVGHILFQTADANGQALSQDKQDAAKKKADEILAKVKANGDFAALAKEFSEDPGSKDSGGEYTITKTSQMVPEFLNWSFAPGRKVGDSEVIKTTYGFHVMKMIKIFTYDEIKDTVKGNYLSEKYSKDMEAWKKDTKKYPVVKNAKVLDTIAVP